MREIAVGLSTDTELAAVECLLPGGVPTSAPDASRQYDVVAMCVIEAISAGGPISGKRPKTQWMELTHD